jgi:hypothetical protein
MASAAFIMFVFVIGFLCGVNVGLHNLNSYIPTAINPNIREPPTQNCLPDLQWAAAIRVLTKRKLSFCSSAKVASTTSRSYFMNISGGEVVVPENAQFGVHNANFIELRALDLKAQQWVLTSPEWTRVLIVRNVVERFVSGFLDKVIKDCEKGENIHHAVNYYNQYGFSCDKHQDAEAFISLLESVPRMEGHFGPQASICLIGKFPYTDVIYADENLDENLSRLSERLGIDHPHVEKGQNHSTGAKSKFLEIFKGRAHLVLRLLKLYDEDCRVLPKACEIGELLSSLEEKS